MNTSTLVWHDGDELDKATDGATILCWFVDNYSTGPCSLIVLEAFRHKNKIELINVDQFSENLDDLLCWAEV